MSFMLTCMSILRRIPYASELLRNSCKPGLTHISFNDLWLVVGYLEELLLEIPQLLKQKIYAVSGFEQARNF